MQQSNPPPAFPATRWTLVIQVQQSPGSAAAKALEELYKDYWYPIYAYLRRRGYNQHDAEDVTQGFFASLLEAESFQNARSERGRFRSFLLGSLQRYLTQQLRHASAQKRGGQIKVVSLDQATAEDRYGMEPTTNVDPETLYQRTWARSVLERVLDSLNASYAKAGRALVFDTIRSFLEWNDRSTPYAKIAVQLSISEATVRVEVLRMRRLYRQRLEQEIAQTVGSAEDLKDELQFLRTVLAGG